ncbi:maspardin-like [Clytia hemisphaerica]|uniref:Maspardin n=1 Tax=Clytia hemisphaerica TaxID=252671 RepID=A0A7M5X820_9CNID
MGVLSQSQEYQSFRSTVPQQKVVVDSDEEEDKVWVVYDAGPKTVRCPVIFLPPASGTADVFFKQLLALSSSGYRVMSIEYPVYWSYHEWVEGFRRLLDHFRLDKVHIFGASLGGYLAQKFAEHTVRSPRIHSLMLCNSFTDTNVFQQTNSVNVYWMLPGFVLKKMIMDNFQSTQVEPDVADGIDFMVERLDSLGRAEIASRLTLNCTDSYVEPQKLRGIPVTVMDVFDACAISDEVKEEVYKCYPEAKKAHLKTGGNFPYLCRSAEVNLHLQLHLRQFNRTRFSAIDSSYLPDEKEEFEAMTKLPLQRRSDDDDDDDVIDEEEDDRAPENAELPAADVISSDPVHQGETSLLDELNALGSEGEFT